MILIRADANERIGAGHVMRCLTAARALRERGENILFVTADRRSLPPIERAGFPAVCLGTAPENIEDGADKIAALLQENAPALLLTDSYAVTEGYFRALAPYGKLAYFDDLNRATWDVDLLINYNLFFAVFNYGGYEGTRTRLLLGPAYAPLREEFRHLPPRAAEETVTDVFVSAGAADPARVTEKMLQYLCPAFPEVTFHFVVGGMNPRLGEIRALAGQNAALHVDETRMAARMTSCGAAVSAAGATLYELCACGVPTLAYALADNQLAAVERFAAEGLMRSAGDCRGDGGFIGRLRTELAAMLADRAERERMSRAMRTLADGSGADRIAEAMIQTLHG